MLGGASRDGDVLRRHLRVCSLCCSPWLCLLCVEQTDVPFLPTHVTIFQKQNCDSVIQQIFFLAVQLALVIPSPLYKLHVIIWVLHLSKWIIVICLEACVTYLRLVQFILYVLFLQCSFGSLKKKNLIISKVGKIQTWW